MSIPKNKSPPFKKMTGIYPVAYFEVIPKYALKQLFTVNLLV
jgi:hypothetical protein